MARIRFAPRADRDLDDILAYYSQEATPTTVLKIKSKILTAIGMLANFPKLGVPFNWNRAGEFRKLVVISYACVYAIEGEEVIIAAIFDTRQSPNKLKV